MKINRVGSVGETYTDSRSGKMYKCTYAYKDSNGNFDCTWEEIGAVPTNKIEEIVSGTNVIEEKPEGDDSMNVANASEKIPEGKISEKQMDSTKPVNHNHHKTKYTNYSKK